MADSIDPNHRLRPANEQVSSAAVDAVLAEIVQNGRFALAWCLENEFDHLARPLQRALAQTMAYTLRVSDEIGEAGFDIDDHNRDILLSSSAINAIVAAVSSLSGAKSGDALDNPLVIAAITLYVFHELTHIAQKFVKHEQAGDIKQAFGKDIFAMIDCITDVKAAHCVSIIAVAFDGKFSKAAYVEIFNSNVVLAYHVLVDAFSIKGADHKRKRALGLLATCAICDEALACTDENRSELMMIAMTPVYASLVDDKEHIMCVCPESGDIVFVSDKTSNGVSALEVWESLENMSVGDSKAFLRRAFADSFYRDK